MSIHIENVGFLWKKRKEFEKTSKKTVYLIKNKLWQSILFLQQKF